MKFMMIYIIIGIIYGMIFIPIGIKKIKKEHDGERDLFSQFVKDHIDNQIIYLILLVIIVFAYPISIVSKVSRLIMKGRS